MVHKMMHPFDNIKEVPKSDLEELANTQEKNNEVIEKALSTVGNALDHASEMLDDLEKDGMLGSAIRRYAADLATAVGNVARDLEYNADDTDARESRRKWARALIDDAHSQLALEEESWNSDSSADMKSASGDEILVISAHGQNGEMIAARAVSQISEQDLINAVDAARTILLDVEDALKNISKDDAEEIADVGLAVSQMFLWSLQNVHRQITPDSITSGMQGAGANTKMDIEFLDEHAENEHGEESDEKNSKTKSKSGTRADQRLRVLWPPIGPAVGSIASWGKDEAIKNPILSIALAMTLWPAALIGAFVGGPILAADWCLQSSYDALKDEPVVEIAEKSAANLYNVGKFYFVVSKLMVKQSIRVGKRQIERRGGIENIARDIGDWAVDRALHPIESAGMFFNSCKWGAGKFVEGIVIMKDAAAQKQNFDGGSTHEGRDGLR